MHDYFYKYLFILFMTISLCMTIWDISRADSGVEYIVSVSIEGVDDPELKKLLEGASNTVVLQKKPPPSMGLLNKRIQRDIPRMQTILRSRGFYNGNVVPSVEFDKTPVRVSFRVIPGKPFLLTDVDIRLQGEGAFLKESISAEEISGLFLNTPADSKKILDARLKIKKWIRSLGYPYAEIAYPEVIVDHNMNSVSVHYNVTTGSIAVFGPVVIKGLEKVEEEFVLEKIPWREGDIFNADFLDEARRILNGTGLFTAIDIEIGNRLDEGPGLPIEINIRERYRRTFKTGVSYMTDEGAGGKISWDNRNLFGQGESLNVSTTISEISYSAGGYFKRPEFMRPDQNLIISSRLADDSPDAFSSRNFTNLLKIERLFPNRIIIGAGLGLILSEIHQQGDEERYNLFNIPLTLDWDGSDDILDPVRGGRLNSEITLFHDTFSTDLTFVKGSARYSHYFPLSSNGKMVFAARGNLGVMNGAESVEIPADIRFYTGGGGSVRGYRYQSIGPYRQGLPAGGRSLMGLATEIRTKVSDRFGLVFFLDGGDVFEDSLPDLEKRIQWGAGIGFRYYTVVGPMRLDVAFPLDKITDSDDSFQIYLSLGQAF